MAGLARFVFCVGLLGLGLDGAARAAVVRLRPSAEVAGAVIRLGDIADVSDPDPAVIERLSAVTIAPAPAAGADGSVSFAEVRSRLLAVGAAVGAIEFTGSSLVRVRGVAATEPTESVIEPVAASPWSARQGEDVIRQALANFVARQWPRLGRVHIDVSLSAADAATVAATVAATGGIPPGTLRLDGWRAPLDGPQALAAEFPGREGRPERVTLECQLRPLPFVLTVRAPVRQGQIVQAGDLEWMQTEDVADAFTRLPNLVGMQAGRTLRPGEPVRTGDVEAVPLVRSREVVTVTARQAGVAVRREMQALGAGGMGDTIPVTDLDGRERLFVRVTGYHTAEVVGSRDSDSARMTAPVRLVNGNAETGRTDDATGRQVDGGMVRGSAGDIRPTAWQQEPAR